MHAKRGEKRDIEHEASSSCPGRSEDVFSNNLFELNVFVGSQMRKSMIPLLVLVTSILQKK